MQCTLYTPGFYDTGYNVFNNMSTFFLYICISLTNLNSLNIFFRSGIKWSTLLKATLCSAKKADNIVSAFSTLIVPGSSVWFDWTANKFCNCGPLIDLMLALCLNPRACFSNSLLPHLSFTLHALHLHFEGSDLSSISYSLKLLSSSHSFLKSFWFILLRTR